MSIGLVGIGVCPLGTFLHSGCGGSGWQRRGSGFILHILHLRILFLHDVSVYTVRSSVRVNDSFLTRLIVVSFSRWKRGKYWWCRPVLLHLLLHFYVSGWCFMAWVNGNDHICAKQGKNEKIVE